MTLVYLLAGEHSGDVLGARLMAAMRAQAPALGLDHLDFAGVGGPRMEAAGLHSLYPMHELAVMGILEVLPRVRRLSRLLKDTVADIGRRRPDVVVTIDSPGFALRVLKGVAPLGVRRVHYVAPQVWAWREHRVRHFPGLWDKLLCLLPFEPDYFASHGLSGTFVGHPVLESGADTGDAARFRAAHTIAPKAPVVVLMPGSRRTEVGRLLPVYGRTLALLTKRMPDLVPVVPVAAAGAALTKSGTSTLELALAGVPMAVTYRVNPLSGAIARRLIRVPYVAMVNLLAGRQVVPELLQQDCTPAKLSETLERLLTDEAEAGAQRTAFRAICDGLRPPEGKPSDAAAHAVLEILQKA